MNVLVTGVSGFVGSHLLPVLADHQLSGVLRRGEDSRLVNTYRSLDEVDCSGVDCVVHLAGLAHEQAADSGAGELNAVNIHATVDLYRRACEAGVGRFIWLSSIKVLGDEADTPLSADAPYNPGDSYAASKAAAEQQLLAMRNNTTQLAIVRPPLVYGAGVKANFASLVKAALSPWPLPLGAARAPRAWVGVGNLVDLLRHLVETEHRIDGIWHVCDAAEASVCEMLTELRGLAGQPKRLFAVNTTMLRFLARVVGRSDKAQRLFAPLRVDMTETTARLSWQPPYSRGSQLREVVDWFNRR